MANLAYDLRVAIRADLIAQGIVTATQCVVERQGDVVQLVAAIVAKVGATAVTIAPVKWEILNRDARSLYFDATIRIDTWARPVFATSGTVPEEDLVEAIIRRLHHLEVAGIHDVVPGIAGQRLEVVSVTDIEDPEFLRTQIVLGTVLCLT